MDRETYLNTARALAPELASRAKQAEAERNISRDTFNTLVDTGLLRALQPKAYGGLEMDPLTFFEAQMELATECASSGWILGILGIHNWHLGLFPKQAIEDVWADDPTRQISSALAPTGTAEIVPGGYLIKGSWPFSSGSHHCDWAILGGFVRAAEGRVRAGAFLIPKTDYRIQDVWHVLGLRGTGSNTIVIDEPVFVPEHRFHSQAGAYASGKFDENYVAKSISSAPMVRLPFGCVFSSAVAAPAVGVARGALRRFVSATADRRSNIDRAKAASSYAVVDRFSRASAEIDAAHNAFRRNWTEFQQLAENGKTVPLILRARARAEISLAVERCANAVESLFQVSGSSAIFDDSAIQRSLRDVISIRAHFSADATKAAPIHGEAVFGTLDAGPQHFL